MRLHHVSVLFCTLIIPALALPPRSFELKRNIHEKRDNLQQRWARSDGLDPDHIIPARIGLTQSNLDLGPQYLDEISNPNSPLFGNHYTIQQITELFASSATSVQIVKSWLIDSGIAEERISLSVNKAWLQFDASIQEMEGLLQTKYYFYEHASGGRKHIGCEDYHVPARMSEHIDYVIPGVKSLATRAMGEILKRDLASLSGKTINGVKISPEVLARIQANPDDTSDCPSAMTPACIRALYNIPAGKLSNPSNSLGIFAFGSVYAQEDLDSFFATYSPNIPAGTHPVPAFIDGATAPETKYNAGREAELDFEIAYPIVYPQTTTDYQTEASQWDFEKRPGLFNTFLDAIDGSYCTYQSNNETGDNPNIDPVYPTGQRQCGVYTPTNVISLSYGLVERDYPDSYQIRQCNEFMKLALQGITIVVASGDAGVRDGNGGCLGPNHDIFVPNYPSCPYVTLVGATELPVGSSPGDPETAASADAFFASGGGFSNIFAQPSYQTDSVNSYLTKYSPSFPSYSSLNGTLGANGGVYNKIGRAYPDISANGVNAPIIQSGGADIGSGTSMSTPLIAGIFTRINEERLAVGKKRIGFVNPVLYQNTQMFNDILVGDQSLEDCVGKFFECVPGWDPVTGLGTPRYQDWLAVWMALP